MIRATSNIDRVTQSIDDYVRNCGVEESAAVNQVARRITMRCLKWTPPFETMSDKESFGVQRRVGTFAVKRDLSRAFRTIDDLKILTASKKPLVFKKIQKAVDKHDSALLATVLTNFHYPNMTADRIVEAATPALHDSLRKKGRVPPDARAFFVFKKASLGSLETTRLAALGRGKAGWMPAAAALEVSVPAWISRHGAQGMVADRSKNVVDPSFAASNNVAYLFDFASQKRLVDRAMGDAADSLERQIVAKRTGLWSKRK